ncbi:HD-GYP domain-containing protein [Clostridium coskatii]|uniref:Cyclic di-GMP phosphodiesterase response regulator RpfG n=1 Tax=Clostridium coskatii TaxID=1705578 RepID=A0A166SYH5_9CLOT|nr:HD-GYP domain-containing protein [Clostridium coskatii]OAA92951.1 Cyclic di-GMP phosphodiesterase response regulator RpfG [Clostridium coskatii]OBR90507.1 cyclic di-GMP phosphodiesterase response regulator RpfG [Clostridium coskatii]
MKVSMDKTIRAMSIALDLAQMSSKYDSFNGNDPVIENITNINYSDHRFIHHSQRTTYIALEIANYLKLSDNFKKQLYVSALLHDIGAATFLSQSHSANLFIKEHCELGNKITKSFPYFHDISKIILYHHENFDGSGAMGLKGDMIPLESQIIRISDLIELIYNENISNYQQKNNIILWIKQNSKKIFSETIANAFLGSASSDMFWLNLQNIDFIDFILDETHPKLNMFMDLHEFEAISKIFANIIDNKSKFTATHSKGIASLAYLVSKFIGYPEEKCHEMKIAGLLHDIGKLSIPLYILDKNGSLSSEEFGIIKSHAYYTRIILNKIGDIPNISKWASNHHEKLNGRGYPQGLKADELSEECRIMAVCDIYQALTENRPYRNGMSSEKAFNIMDEMVSGGFICDHALNHLKEAISNLSNLGSYEDYITVSYNPEMK